MNWFLESNDSLARLCRTIAQGVIAVIIAYLTTVSNSVPEIVSLLVIPIVMAILSPIMALIGAKEAENQKGE